MIARSILAGLVALGLFSSARLTWFEVSTGQGCPHLGPLPACYIAFAAYLTMMLGLLVGPPRFPAFGRWALALGLLIAFLLAATGSVLELTEGHVCPRTAGIPMCFVSLAMCISIGSLFRWVARERAKAA